MATAAAAAAVVATAAGGVTLLHCSGHPRKRAGIDKRGIRGGISDRLHVIMAVSRRNLTTELTGKAATCGGPMPTGKAVVLAADQKQW